MEHKDRKRLGDLVQLAVLVVAVIAVVQELRKPKDQREWHGTVGPVPYDLRRPTSERVRARLWAPEAALIQPHPFGVGWTINVGRLLGRFRASR